MKVHLVTAVSAPHHYLTATSKFFLTTSWWWKCIWWPQFRHHITTWQQRRSSFSSLDDPCSSEDATHNNYSTCSYNNWNRAVVSLTVPGRQELAIHFPRFFLKFWSIFLIFPQTLLIFFLILALRVGKSPTREGPGYFTEPKQQKSSVDLLMLRVCTSLPRSLFPFSFIWSVHTPRKFSV